jgi:hypothetical protein
VSRRFTGTLCLPRASLGSGAELKSGAHAVITMPLRAFACVVVLAALMAPSLASAGCSASDRPPGVTANSVVFTPTSDTTLHVNWSAPPNLNIDLIIDDLTADQSNINRGKPGGSVTGGLKGATDYDVTNLTPSHNYRLTISTRSPQNGCLSHQLLVLTAATLSTADSNTAKRTQPTLRPSETRC